ncbi:MAG: ABC transporter substrate-binding protein [Betaproteobacteria bacterium]|nr:MAG: ABC transporter substrate-binding protein [Betaproteobacteria bacterium]
MGIAPRVVTILSLTFTAALSVPTAAIAQQPTVLRVNTFPTASYSPILVGIANGVFEKRGMKVELQFTPNSDVQREGLAKGAFEIVHAAVDNAVAMVEMAHEDVVIVTGGDTGMNEFMVRPEIKSIADIRGKNLVVDAPNTAYGLLARKILKNAGLVDGRDYTLKPIGGTPLRIEAMEKSPENAAAMLNPPFSFSAKDKGLKSFGRAVDLLGPYQAGGAFVMRKWASANGPLLERYIAAYIESVRMTMAPESRAQVVSLISTRFKQDQKVAERTYEVLVEPRFGLAPDAKFDMDGFRAVLALRAEIEGQWGGKPPAPDKYIDLGYYERAMKLLERR